MKENSQKNSKLRRRLSRLFLWLPVLLVALGILLFSVLQIPKVQTKLLNKVSFLISENTGFDIKVGHANLTWFDHMIIKNVRLYDHQNDSTLIFVEKIQINLKLYDFIMHRRLNADRLELDRIQVHLIKTTDSTEVNISRFIADLKGIFKKNNQNKKKKTTLTLDEVTIRDGLFTYNDLRFDTIQNGKDYHHFAFDSIQSNISNLTFSNDSLGMNIEQFVSIDPTDQLNIKRFISDFSYTKQRMTFGNLDLKTDNSRIGNSLVFEYAHSGQFKYFVDSISFYSHLNQSLISSDDIALFSPSLKEVNKKIDFTGDVYGSVGRLKVKNFNIRSQGSSYLLGNAEFYGLPTLKETFMNLEVEKSIVDPVDVSNLISKKYLQEVLNIGKANIDGHFMGFLSDFVADGEISSSVGKVKTDINFKIQKDNRAWYKGSLDLLNFDLRSILHQQEQLKEITLSGKIKGHGLTIDNANFNLDAKVDSLKIKNYTYHNLSTNGEFKVGFFNGTLAAKDPNLIFQGKVSVDLKDQRNKVNIKAKLDTINLRPLGFSSEEIGISSLIDIDMKGLKTDDLVGYISLYDNHISYDKKTLNVDSIKFLSSLIGANRIIHFETDGLTGEMKGEFRNSVFLKTISEFYKEIKLNILNNEEDLQAYYTSKINNTLEPYHVNIDLNFWDLNRFVQPFYPDFNISKEVKIHGSFIQDSTSRLSLHGAIDTLQVSKTTWAKNYLDVNISKEYYDRNTLASAFASSNKQFWSDKYETENTFTDIIWFEDSMSVTLNIEQPQFSNRLALASSVRFFTDSTRLHFHNSDIEILGKEWIWNKQNKIVHSNGEWSFKKFTASNGPERLEISGMYAEAPEKSLFIDLKEFKIENIQSILNSKIEGTVDGRVKVKRQPTYDLIEGNLIVNTLKIEDYLIGNVFGLSTWDSENERLAMNLDLIQKDKKKIEIKGLYYPKRATEQLDLKARFDSANLKIAEPFIKKSFTQINGFASGQFTIRGTPKYPILKGTGTISNGSVLINYLNTRYKFSGHLIFDENEISTKNLTLWDSEGHVAHLNGGVFHDGFKNPVLDFSGDFENFKLLNTAATDNNAYYGVAYGTGHINFLGAIDNIKISAEAQTTKGTRLSIPLGESSDSRIEQKEYIEFIDLKDERNVQKVIEEVHTQEKLKIKGIELDLDLEFTPDAYVELIFDVQAGDIIRGRGNSNIKLQINTDGDFTMFGDYTIETGGYNFTLYNIINKEFDIKKGSTISWYGNPYGANLDISASYRQLASLAPLMVKFLDPDDTNSPETRKKYPSIVDLKLKGNLLTPEIKFDINIEDYPPNNQLPNSSVTLDEVVTAFKARLKNNEQEMNRQVFSLIILRKFSPENSFQVNSQTLGNSLSEFVSNQLSYWATQVDENLEVDVDLAGLSDDAYNTFQLRLSYTFLDGRLRVTRGGNLPNQETKGDVSTIIGDWTVEYLLTEDGRFRVKMYSRSDLDEIDTQVGESNFETGFSLQYIKSFDQLNQILSDNRKKNLSKRKEKDQEKEI
ncbi:translocation/assembly module TamB [Reichenbachiella carrageenanivorans]|uniref:Translocation/assembly module TamB n=1 Tax=Reichenbachiella carrageenanivorans TaxID=2979869 RepID=A0ABY6D4V0_9BACT|nr:translocation/assembly module TamB [Reichenbachiella carrageenanivorans]UXX78875.1 translocation/assembly module TamB [Reichenbachiella carrageenanivorans]